MNEAVVDCPMLYTHQHLDLDAAASLWFYLRFVEPDAAIAFKPASWDGAELRDGDVALDLDVGIKGRRDPDGRVHSCFMTLIDRHAGPQDQKALADLATYVDAQDATGDAVRALGCIQKDAVRVLSSTGLTALFRALQSACGDDDYRLLERMCPLFDALLEQGRSRVRAEQEADQAEWIGRVAVQRDAREFATMEVLFARGALAVVYVEGYALGVVRAKDVDARMDAPPIRDLTAEEDRWFFHESGFMATRGSRKAPVNTPSRVSAQALAGTVDQVLRPNAANPPTIGTS
jgi:hypothetical protein